MHYRKITCIFLTLFLLAKIALGNNYISIKEVTTKANLRVGPGSWYPIKWIIETPSLPLKLLEENENYFKVQLHDSTVGWISKTLISKKKNLIVINDTILTNKKGKLKAKILKNYIIEDHDCLNKKHQETCFVKIEKIKGFIKKSDVWGYN